MEQKRGSRKVRTGCQASAEPRRKPEPDSGRRARRRGVGPRPACGRCAHRHQRHPYRRQQQYFQHRRTTFDCGPPRPARYARLASRSRTPSRRAYTRGWNGRDPLHYGQSVAFLRRVGQAADGGNAIGEGRRPQRQRLYLRLSLIPRLFSKGLGFCPPPRTARRVARRGFRRIRVSNRGGQAATCR